MKITWLLLMVLISSTYLVETLNVLLFGAKLQTLTIFLLSFLFLILTANMVKKSVSNTHGAAWVLCSLEFLY
jgi:hypothetical protein